LKPIRILLLEMPRVQTELLRSMLGRHTDVETHELSEYRDLDHALRESRAEVVIRDRGRSEPPRACLAFLEEHPSLKIVSVGDEGRRGFVCELVPRETDLGELRPETLIEAVRRVARGTTGTG
jgi:DNA-binding NarL/FixJ family response regulator